MSREGKRMEKKGKIIEIRSHGRGGQGVVIFSELLAKAAYLDGYMAQSFPFFGAEKAVLP